MPFRIGLSSLVYLIFAGLVILPLCGILGGAFSAGAGSFLSELTGPAAVSSLKLTALITVVTVAINGVFGTAAALVIARRQFRGWSLLNGIVDVPFAVSPVIAGLALILVYGPHALIGQFLHTQGIHVIFAVPGMVIATLFVTYPFVVRELVPVLRDASHHEEDAAYTLGANRWQVFWHVTLPTIRWSLAYGVILTVGRSLGEFGAVLVVSGNILNVTQSATLYVYQATVDQDMHSAYAVSVVLALASFVVVLLTELLKKRKIAGLNR